MKLHLYKICLLFCCSALSFQRVNINEASTDQIALLPGIGTALAKRIAKKRLLGHIIDEKALLNIPGISISKIKAIRNFINYDVPKKNHNNIEKKKIKIRNRINKTLQSLEEATLQHLNLTYETEKSLLNRSRYSGLLPKLSLFLDTDRRGYIKKTDIVNGRTTKDEKNDAIFGFGIKLSFDLASLIYNKDEIDILKLSLKRADLRAQVLEKLHNAYHRYHSLYNRLEHNTVKKHQTISLISDINKSKSILNSLSGGNFKE